MLGPCAVPPLKLILADLAESLADWDYPDCAAPFWRLYWNESGRGLVRLGKERYALEGDAVLLIPPETHFGARAETPMDHLYLHFLAGPPFDRAAPGIMAGRAEGPELGDLARLAGSLRDARARPDSAAEAAPPAEADLAASLLAASLCYRRLALVPAGSLRRGEGEELAARFAALVRGRLADPPSVPELARELGLSAPSLERKIRAATGRSAHAYLLWLRVGEACIRLRHGDEPVEEIAESLGFSDRSHFSRTFARLRGESPAAYRRSSP